MIVARKMMRLAGLICLMPLVFGCHKSPPAPSGASAASAQNATPSNTILRIHWAGRRNIASDTNSADVMRIWKMPETVRLEAQTLDKLSAAPWHFLREETNKFSASLLRPLLEDLIEEETCVEMASPRTNSEPEMVIAVRLNDPRAALWQTNLTAVLESLTGTHPTNAQPFGSISHWSLTNFPTPRVIDFGRVGGWMLVGAAQDQNTLFADAIDRVRRNQLPINAPTDKSWLEARADLSRFGGKHFSSNSPVISLTVTGEDQKVRTLGELTFPHHGLLDLPAWKAPTNLISSDLTSFTAIRGIKDLLGSSKLWQDLQAGEAPDQIFVWSAPDVPSATYFAVPCVSASNTVSKIGILASNTNSSWFAATHLLGSLKSGEATELQWSGVPFLSPFLESTNVNGSAFIFGGLFKQETAETGPPPTLLPQLNQANLVAYDWEMTSPRIKHLLYLGQLARVTMGKSQMPKNSLSLAWLMAASRWGAFSATEVTQTAPGQFTFKRKSSIGLTALELHLLADWLESPDFPLGLHTLSAKPAPIPPGVQK